MEECTMFFLENEIFQPKNDERKKIQVYNVLNLKRI